MNITEVKVTDIQINGNVRKGKMTNKDVQDLADSINEIGLLQPVILKKNAKSYEIIAGQRRLKAHQLLKLETIPSIVLDPNDENIKRAMQLSENVVRKDLTIAEQVKSIKWFLEQKLSVETIGKLLSMSESTIRNRLKLARLDHRLAEFLEIEQHYDDLYDIADYPPHIQKKAINECIEDYGGVSVHGTKRMIGELVGFRLSEAPFKLEDKKFGKACKGCSTRTDCQFGIFESVFKEDHKANCLDNNCYTAKVNKLIEYVGELVDKSKLIEDERAEWATELQGHKVLKHKQFKVKTVFGQTEEMIMELLGKYHYYTISQYGNIYDIHLAKTSKKSKGKGEAESKSDVNIVPKERVSARTANAIRKFVHFDLVQAMYTYFKVEHGFKSNASMFIAKYLFEAGKVKEMMETYTNRYRSVLGRESVMVNQINLGEDDRLMNVGQRLIDKCMQHWLMTNEFRDILNDKLKLPKLIEFDIKIWFNAQMKDDDWRMRVMHLFTKAELLNTLRTGDRLTYNNKKKTEVAQRAAQVHKTFPLFKDVIGHSKFNWEKPDRFKTTLDGTEIPGAKEDDD